MVDIAQLWRLIAESRLLGATQITALQQEFGELPGAQNSNAKTLAEWLIEKNVFSRYQTTILLNGRSGPFIYGDYRIFDRLTDGPFAQSFRAVHAKSGHPVLLRFVTGPTSESASAWSKFAEQITNWSRSNHPSLRLLHESVDLGSFKFVVCQDGAGKPIDELLAARGGRLAPQDAAAAIYQAASALSEVHSAGLAHGHLRPARLLENAGLVQVLADPDELHELPKADVSDALALELADYRAPELARPGKAFDVLTDVYSLGCCFYYLLTGKPPFEGGDVQGKMQRHATEAIKPLESQGVPSQIAEIVTYMMAKNVGVRLASMQIVMQKLSAVLATVPSAPPSPPATLTAFRESLLDKPAPQETPIQVNPFGDGGGAPSPGIQVEPAAQSVATVRKPKRPGKKSVWSKYMPIIVGTFVLAGGAGLLLLIKALNKTDEVVDKDAPRGNNVKAVTNRDGTKGTGTKGKGTNKDGKTKIKTNTPVDTGQFKRQIVVNDDRLPWASPTDGDPVSLAMMPPGGQAFLIARPSSLLSSPHGPQVLRAFGPAMARSQSDLESACGFSMDQIDELVMGVLDNGEAFPRASFRIKLQTPHTREAILAKWGNPSPTKHQKGAYYLNKGWAYYLPGEGEVTTFAMGYEADIKDVVEFEGAAPPLRRGMTPLIRSSDRDRHLTILFAPNFVATNVLRDGRKLYFGDPKKPREFLAWMFGDTMDAGAVSFHFDQQFFVELRAHATLENNKQQVADGIKQRVHELPGKIAEYVASMNPHRYWRLVAISYPEMMKFVDRNVRVGVEADQSVATVSLPGVAAHNLIFCSEMLLVSAPGGSNVGPAPKPKPPQTIQELLTRPFDVDIPQNDLNLAVDEMLKGIKEKYAGMPFDFQVKILGGDLMADGITRNQAIVAFKLENKPLSEVFTRLVMKANGDNDDPTLPKQKLIWVLGPDPANASNQIMLLTTRKAAAAKNYTVPDVFKPKE